ncbi:MAG: DUF5666 domain-containing protein [Terriglobia bacterium]
MKAARLFRHTTRRRPALAAACALLAFIACSAPAVSAQSPDQGSKFDLEGKITELSAGKLTVNTEDNIIFQVTYDDKTAVHRKGGTSGSAKDLAAGETIKIEGTLTPAGVIQAQTISIE